MSASLSSLPPMPYPQKVTYPLPHVRACEHARARAPSVLIRCAAKPMHELHQGALKRIELAVEERHAGRKHVTRVRGLEVYSLDAETLRAVASRARTCAGYASGARSRAARCARALYYTG